MSSIEFYEFYWVLWVLLSSMVLCFYSGPWFDWVLWFYEFYLVLLSSMVLWFYSGRWFYSFLRGNSVVWTEKSASGILGFCSLLFSERSKRTDASGILFSGGVREQVGGRGSLPFAIWMKKLRSKQLKYDINEIWNDVNNEICFFNTCHDISKCVHL